MKRAIALTCLLAVASAFSPALGDEEPEQDQPTPAVLDFVMTDINGHEVDLAQFLGDVVLIVNTASKCGYTPQYADLQSLHEAYADRGLVILGFPCNQFNNQEPGSDEDIAAFCEQNYGVEFRMFSKIEVNGDGAAPLYQYLTGEDCPVEDTGPVRWNFEKFLIDREGNVVARYRSGVNPQSDEVIEAIEEALGPGPESDESQE